MGENGYEHVKQNFLLTRHVKEYMLTMLAMEHPGESVVHLN
jgi:trehalose synthase